jgi:PEP-CTERM motif
MKIALGLCLAATAAATLPAQAALLTTAPGGVATVINFAQFTEQQVVGAGLQVGGSVGSDVFLTAVGDHRIGPGNNHEVGLNGAWNRTAVYNNDNLEGSFTFSFNSAPVAWVGGFVNYAPGFSPTLLIQTLDSAGNVTETWDLVTAAPISTPNGIDAGAFRGIARETADIYGFRVSYGYAALDDLSFSTSPVPEPGSVALMSLGIAGLAGAAWRRRRAS